MRQRYLKKSEAGPGLVHNQDFAKEEGFESNVEMFLKLLLNWETCWRAA